MTQTSGVGALVVGDSQSEGAEMMLAASPAAEHVIWSIDQSGHMVSSSSVESFCYVVEDDDADAESCEILDDLETMALLREAEEDVRHGRTIDGDDLRSAP